MPLNVNASDSYPQRAGDNSLPTCWTNLALNSRQSAPVPANGMLSGISELLASPSPWERQIAARRRDTAVAGNPFRGVYKLRAPQLPAQARICRLP